MYDGTGNILWNFPYSSPKTSLGDFNGDGRANTSDLVVALSDGGYEAGPAAAVAAVPEPSCLTLILLGGLLALPRRRKD